MTSDLVVLAADTHIEQAMIGLLGRPQALGIRSVSFSRLVHPNRDSGCYHTGHELIGLYARSTRYGLVVFDRDWEGAPSQDPDRLAKDVERRLQGTWGDRARCVVIEPEVESWIWSDSPHVDEALGWKGRDPRLREWLQAEGLWDPGDPKPKDPKLALERALRAVRMPLSSSIFRRIAESVSFKRCMDPAFRKLQQTLKDWFNETGSTRGP